MEQMMMFDYTFEDLEGAVLAWGDERGILKNGKALTQAIKTVEEVAELLKALSKNDKAEIVDGIGDAVVTLILCAELSGTDVVTCLGYAYGTIKDRKGYLTPDGIFVKEEP